MKKLPTSSPFIPYYDNPIENAATNPAFLFNDDAIFTSLPYDPQEEISNPINSVNQIKACFEIGNSAEIEDSSNIHIEIEAIDFTEITLDDDILM